ncbi:hypothetical protein [Sediminitomix flava]|uniref:Tetratricopeptide repeat protein n=1 Tax=Sediminitomix flava TaxID=379075 RepID=A0A315Z0Q0_SEDFL|nr:hypothetical protein [Sediminitomix flava]PWJ35041.1 hypothetical protein BC781_11082 [Sediminitomix flava]
MRKFATIIALITLSISASFSAFASNDLYNEKTNKYESLKTKVAAANSSDWNTPFVAAQICLTDLENMSEAYLWIEQSIKAQETVENRTLKGDYFALYGLDQLAFNEYQKALDLQIANGHEDFSALQNKIQALGK